MVATKKKSAPKKPVVEEKPKPRGPGHVIDDMSLDTILDEIDELISPDEMTREAAIDWLEDLMSSIDRRIDAMKEEQDGEV